MRVNPVSFIPATETAGEQADSRLASIPKQGSGLGETSPEFGTDPKRDAHDPKNEPQPSEIGEDEVQVQRDSESNNEIVIKYVDRAGNLILQVPSSQVLGLARAIEQALAEQSTERENARQAASEGGKSRGH
jgi:hypothetical protein